MKIAILGLWHQGVVGAACLAEMGHEVDRRGCECRDHREAAVPARRRCMSRGSTIFWRRACNGGKLTFTTDVAAAVRGAPFVFVMFDTPVDENDESDLSGIFTHVRHHRAGA